MPALQVRDLPQDLYDELRTRAEAEHRSLAQETVVAIERHVRRVAPVEASVAPARPMPSDDVGREERIAKRKVLFAAIARAPKVEIPDDFPSVVEIIREGRESR